MKPRLFSAAESAYTSYGIGPLSDCASCLVTEEANGAYTLRLQLPQNSAHLSALTRGTQILTPPNPYDRPQPFRVKRVGKPLNGLVSVYAEHLSYDLAGVVIGPFTASTAAQAIGYMNSKRIAGDSFTFSTDLSVSNPMTVDVPTAAWQLLAGRENTLQYNYGGEFRFDRRTVQLLRSRGQDRGFAVRYGVNMTGLSYEESDEDFYTGVLPFWTDGETTVTAAVQNAPGSFGFTKVMPLDLSGEFDTAPSTAQLSAKAAAYITANNIGQPVIRIRAEIVPPYSRGFTTLEDARLYDTVLVEHRRYGIHLQAQVVKTVYDVLRERYQSIEIGNRLVSVAQTIAEPTRRIADNAVTARMIQANSVGSAKLRGGSVTSAKLADNSVSVMKIVNGAVVTEKIATDAVTAAKLLNGAVTVNKIANGAVVTDKIATDAVTATKILDGSVTGTKVLDQAIAYAKLSNSLQVFYNDTIAANALFAGVIYAQGSVSCSTLIVSGTQFAKGTISFIDGLGNSRSYSVLKEAGT